MNQKILKNSEGAYRFQKIPKGVQKMPKDEKTFQRFSNESKIFLKGPNDFKKFQYLRFSQNLPLIKAK